MSHFTTITTEIRDIEALRAACGELGLTVLNNAEARGYGGVTQHGEHVIQLKGPYDIALHRQSNGAYRLSCDWWDGHVEREVGPRCGRLLQLYAVHKTIREARRKGLTEQRVPLTNGAIKLTLGGL